jgi:AraC-like DNA-binding protein
MNEDVRIMPFKSGSAPIAIPSIGKTFANSNYLINKLNEDNFAFEFVVSGKGYVRTEKGIETLSAGDVFISRPHKPRYYYADSKNPFVKIWFLVIGDLPFSILNSYNLNDTVYHVPECFPIFEGLYNQSKKGEKYQDICRLGATSILKIADLICFSHSKKSYTPEYLITAKDYINENYTKNLTIEEISSFAHVSPSQLTRTFKKYLNQTPYKYLLNLKLEASKIMLSSSNLSIKQIALNLGFCDEHYFSSFFYEKTGFSPSKYRG